MMRLKERHSISMGLKLFLLRALVLCLATKPVHCKYNTTTRNNHQQTEKKTILHFFFHDTISGKRPSSVMVAHANFTTTHQPLLPFGSIFVVDVPLTEGPYPTSKTIGNARGIYVPAGRDELTVVTYLDYGFTTGKFSGSSISVFSRNPAMETQRELAVVGGRGKFRMARGFAKLKTLFFNMTTGLALVEYKVTVIHY